MTELEAFLLVIGLVALVYPLLYLEVMRRQARALEQIALALGSQGGDNNAKEDQSQEGRDL